MKKSKFDIKDGRYGLDLLSESELKKELNLAAQMAIDSTGTQFGPSVRERYAIVKAYLEGDTEIRMYETDHTVQAIGSMAKSPKKAK